MIMKPTVFFLSSGCLHYFLLSSLVVSSIVSQGAGFKPPLKLNSTFKPAPLSVGRLTNKKKRGFCFFICLGGSLPFHVQTVWSVGTVNRRHNRSKKSVIVIFGQKLGVFSEGGPAERTVWLPNTKLPPSFPLRAADNGTERFNGEGNRPVRITHS